MNASMPSYALVKGLLDAAGGAGKLREKVISTGLIVKMDAPVLESWTKAPVDFDSIDPVEKTARLIDTTKSLLPLHWLCGRAGVFFVPGPASFSPILGQGAQTWFTASLQLHDLRQTVIRAFLDSLSGQPLIDEREGRLIARCWAAVFGWIEGFLQVHGEELQEKSDDKMKAAPAKLHPVLFRTTSAWQVLAEVFADKKCPTTRAGISEAVAHPFGAASQSRKRGLIYPKENTIDKWAERRATDSPPGKGTRGPLDYTLALCYGAQSLAPLEWLAGKAGGKIVCPTTISTSALTNDDPLRFWERTMVELAELDSSIARALLDQKINQSEVAQLRKEWTDVVAWMEAFVIGW